MSKFQFYLMRFVLVAMFCTTAFSSFSLTYDPANGIYPPVLYCDGDANGTDTWDKSVALTKCAKAHHMGDGVYYLNVYRPGSSDGMTGSNGGGRFRVFYPNTDANTGAFSNVTWVHADTNADYTLAYNTPVSIQCNGTGVAFDIIARDRQHPTNPDMNKNPDVFVVKIDLKNSQITLMPSGTRPRELFLIHNPTNDAYETGKRGRYSDWNNTDGHSNFDEPLLETSPGSGIYKGQCLFIPQDVKWNAGKNAKTEENDCYFYITGYPSFIGSSITDAKGNQGFKNFVIMPNESGKCTLGTTKSIKILGKYETQQYTEGESFALDKTNPGPGQYNVTVNLNNNTILIEKGIPDDLYTEGRSHGSDAFGFANKKCDHGNPGEFYITLNPTASFGFTTKAIEKYGPLDGDVMERNRIASGPYFCRVDFTDNKEVPFKSDPGQQSYSYGLQVENNVYYTGYAYAKLDFNTNKANFSKTPFNVYMNYGADGTGNRIKLQSNGTNKWIARGVNLKDMKFNFCTMNEYNVDYDVFGPDAETTLANNTKTTMTAHTAAGKYVATEAHPIPGIASYYTVEFTCEEDSNGVLTYYVTVTPEDVIYLVGNKDVQATAGDWNWDSSRPLTKVSDGVYQGTHVYLPAENTAGTYSNLAYCWFTTTPGTFETASANALAYGSDIDARSMLGEEIGCTASTSYSSGSYILTPGHYDITVNTTTNKVTFTRTVPDALYVYGAIANSSWGSGKSEKMYANGAGHYYGTIVDKNTDSNHWNDCSFTFLDIKDHRYATPKENEQLYDATFNNTFAFTEQIYKPSGNYWGSYNTGKNPAKLTTTSPVLYVDCDYLAKTTKFSTTPFVMAVVIGNQKVIMKRGSDGKFTAENINITENFFLTTMPAMTKAELTANDSRRKYSFFASSDAVVSGSQTAVLGGSNLFNIDGKKGAYDITFDPSDNTITITDIHSNPTAGGEKVLLGLGRISSYTNPIHVDTPDPSTVRGDDGKFYTYGTWGHLRISDNLTNQTDGGSRKLQIDEASDLYNYVLPHAQTVGQPVALWAPDVTRLGKNNYIAYVTYSYGGGEAWSGIGVQTATNPAGPWSNVQTVLTTTSSGVNNSIDAQLFIEDDGSKYLVWGSFHGIYIVPMTDDGTAIKAGDGGLNSKVKIAGSSFEGSYIFKRNGYYYYIGSIGTYVSTATVNPYALIVARSKNLFGPYLMENGVDIRDCNDGTHYENNPGKYQITLTQNDKFHGPGHNGEVITDDEGQDWIIYHAWDQVNTATARKLMLDKVTWTWSEESGDWPRINGSTKETPATPSYTEKEGPVFYQISDCIELTDNHDGTYTKSDVNFDIAEVNRVRVLQQKANDQWGSEWSMFSQNYGAADIKKVALTPGDEQPMNTLAANPIAYSFSALRGTYDATVKLNASAQTIQLTNPRDVKYPERMWMIGKCNGAPNWNNTDEVPIELIPAGDGKFYTTVYRAGSTNPDDYVEFAFLSGDATDPFERNNTRWSGWYQPTPLTEFDNTEYPCFPQRPNHQPCYQIAADEEDGIYYVTFDVKSATMIINKSTNDGARPGGLYLIHQTAQTTAETNHPTDWYDNSTFMLQDPENPGVYSAENVRLHINNHSSASSGIKQGYFYITSIAPRSSSNSSEWNGPWRKGSYGITEITDTKWDPSDLYTPMQGKDEAEFSNFIQQPSYLCGLAGFYQNMTLDTNNNTFKMTKKTDFSDINVYVKGNLMNNKLTIDDPGNKRLPAYNAGGGKYYVTINATNVTGEQGKFYFVTTDSDDALETARESLGDGFNGEMTNITIGDTKGLFPALRRTTDAEIAGRSPFTFKPTAIGKYYAVIDLYNNEITFEKYPRVIFLYPPLNGPHSTNDGYQFNDTTRVFHRVPGTDCDFKLQVLYPGTTNVWSLISTIIPPSGFPNGMNQSAAKELAQQDAYSASMNDIGGSWGAYDLLSRKGSGYYGLYNLAQNNSLGILMNLKTNVMATDSEANMSKEGFKLFSCKLQTQQNEGFNGNSFGLEKIDDDTYFYNLPTACDHTTATANCLRFFLVKDGKYVLGADNPAQTADCTSAENNVTDKWQTGTIGTENSSGIFHLDKNLYNGIVVKRVGLDSNGKEQWKVAALTRKAEAASAKGTAQMTSDYILVQPETVSWETGEGATADKAVSVLVYDKDMSQVKAFNKAAGTSSINLYGIYTDGNEDVKNGYVVVENKYGDAADPVSLYSKLNFSKTANPRDFSNSGELMLDDAVVTNEPDGSTIYHANLQWNYATFPAFQPSYYTLVVEDVLNNDLRYNVDFAGELVTSGVTDGIRVRGGDTDRLWNDVAAAEEYRGTMLYNVNYFAKDANGDRKLKYILRPKYLVYEPAEITDQIVKPAVTTKNRRIKSAGDAPIPVPEDWAGLAGVYSGTELTTIVTVNLETTPTGVDNIINGEGASAVIGGEGFIKVVGENVRTVDVVNMNGLRLASRQGECTVNLEKGHYIVIVDGKAVKVAVK